MQNCKKGPKIKSLDSYHGAKNSTSMISLFATPSLKLLSPKSRTSLAVIDPTKRISILKTFIAVKLPKHKSEILDWRMTVLPLVHVENL